MASEEFTSINLPTWNSEIPTTSGNIAFYLIAATLINRGVFSTTDISTIATACGISDKADNLARYIFPGGEGNNILRSNGIEIGVEGGELFRNLKYNEIHGSEPKYDPDETDLFLTELFEAAKKLGWHVNLPSVNHSPLPIQYGKQSRSQNLNLPDQTNQNRRTGLTERLRKLSYSDLCELRASDFTIGKDGTFDSIRATLSYVRNEAKRKEGVKTNNQYPPPIEEETLAKYIARTISQKIPARHIAKLFGVKTCSVYTVRTRVKKNNGLRTPDNASNPNSSARHRRLVDKRTQMPRTDNSEIKFIEAPNEDEKIRSSRLLLSAFYSYQLPTSVKNSIENLFYIYHNHNPNEGVYNGSDLSNNQAVESAAKNAIRMLKSNECPIVVPLGLSSEDRANFESAAIIVAKWMRQRIN